MKFKWRGNLRDDCTAIGGGLMLRAEMMGPGHWWWAVYADEGRKGSLQLAASYDQPPYNAPNGKTARAKAELAAKAYLSRGDNGQ